MSELKSIELLDTVNGGNTSFISLELLGLELDDSTTELNIITDKMGFIFSEMLLKGDEIAEDNGGLRLIKNSTIAETLRGYTEVLYDYYRTLTEKIEALGEAYKPDKISEHITFKDIKTVKCLDNNNDLLDKAKKEIERNDRKLKEMCTGGVQNY